MHLPEGDPWRDAQLQRETLGGGAAPALVGSTRRIGQHVLQGQQRSIYTRTASTSVPERRLPRCRGRVLHADTVDGDSCERWAAKNNHVDPIGSPTYPILVIPCCGLRLVATLDIWNAHIHSSASSASSVLHTLPCTSANTPRNPRDGLRTALHLCRLPIVTAVTLATLPFMSFMCSR